MIGARIVTIYVVLVPAACGGRLDLVQGSTDSAAAASQGGAVPTIDGTSVGAGRSASQSSCGDPGGNCAGGAPGATRCSDGRCLITLATDQGNPASIALDASNVYWPAAGAVMTLPLDGGTPIAVVSGLNFPSRIAVDATNVYFVDYRTTTIDFSDCVVAMAPLDGSAPPTILATRQYFFDMRLAQDTTSIYWTTNSADFAHGTVVKASKASGAVTNLATGQWAPRSIAVDGTRVFWESNYQIMSVPVEGGTPTMVTGGSASATALDASNLYFMSGGTLTKVPLDGGAPVEVVSIDGFPSAGAIAVDDTSAYWAISPDGTIMKAPLDGGTPTILATDQNMPLAIAVDATSVYWVNNGDGRVMKLTPK